MNRATTLSLVVVACASLWGCPPPDYELKLTAEQQRAAYRDDRSGMLFLPTVGSFTRAAVFDVPKFKTSAAYQADSTTIDLKVVVQINKLNSPLKPGDDVAKKCMLEFSEMRREGAYGDIIRMDGRKIDTPVGHPPALGWLSTYRYSAPWRHDKQLRDSAVYIYCPLGNRWLITYSFDWPADHKVQPLIDNFLNHFAWTIDLQ